MYCFLCYCFNDKMQMFQGDLDVFEKINIVLPDIAIPEPKDPVFICATCLEELSFFYTFKDESLQNYSLLKHFNGLLKGPGNSQFNELNIIINSGELTTQREPRVEIKVEPNHDVFFSDQTNSTHIKKEDNEYYHYNQQLENDESNLNNLQDDESSSSSNDSILNNKNVDSYEFADINKLTEKDSNLTLKHSGHKDQRKTRESKKKIFKCTECHKTFNRRGSLKVHSRVHTGDKPYKCLTCQKTFTYSFHLNSHKLTHTGVKPHECDLCSKTFSQKRYLIIHKRIHNNVRPYKCAVCNKGYTQSSSLNIHMLTHTGEKPHQCHLCKYKCTQASDLKTHIRCHTGEKPYSCKHCGKSFTSKSHLKRHERRHHSSEDSK